LAQVNEIPKSDSFTEEQIRLTLCSRQILPAAATTCLERHLMTDRRRYAEKEEIQRCVGTQAAEPEVPKELLDQLITGPLTQDEFETIYRALKKAIIERAMSAEMSDHLGYRHGDPKPAGQTNQRNGTSGKTVITDDGPVDIDVPRDRQGSCEPLIVGKHERRFTRFDQKIIATVRPWHDGARNPRLFAGTVTASRCRRSSSVR
jgi:hypothetical protein